MNQQRNKKKTIEYHFVDVNDPDRYKKLKVARACDFCRKRKSKCDIGIPGSGTCSNCKKSKNVCVFSPVSASSTSNSIIVLKQKKKFEQNNRQAQIRISSHTSLALNLYDLQNSILSLDSKGFCAFEKHTNFVYDHMTSPMNELPNYSLPFKQDLFQIYFDNVHPFFPVLDRFYILQSIDSLPLSLQWAIMALALHFTDQYGDTHILAATYHYHASLRLDQTPDLLTIQTLLLLYKYQEIITPVGSAVSTVAIEYLKQAQSMLPPEQKDEPFPWTMTNEYLCRAKWIIFMIVTMGNLADERWSSLIKAAPIHSPSITEPEQYDKGELAITWNLIHLIHIMHLFSQTHAYIHDKRTLFSRTEHREFQEFSSNLNVWKSTLPSHIALSLSADPPNLYSAQNHSVSGHPHDTSKSNSFTSYLCLMYDILDLIISLHHPGLVDISKKALVVSYRAHSLTIGDMHNPGFSRLACIQGSRMVCYGLTLAIQAQTQYLTHKQDPYTLDDKKKLHSICSLSFQILNEVNLSTELCMAIQTLNQQIKPNKKKSFAENSAYSTIQGDNLSQGASHPYFYTSSTTGQESKSQLIQQQPQQPQQQQQQQQQQQNYYPSVQESWQDYNYSLDQYEPITPTFEQDFHSSFTQEPITPPIHMNMDSYFQPQVTYRSNYAPTVAISLPEFPGFSIPIQNSKSCKNHQLL